MLTAELLGFSTVIAYSRHSIIISWMNKCTIVGSKRLEETDTRQSPEESSGNGYQRLSRRSRQRREERMEERIIVKEDSSRAKQWRHEFQPSNNFSRNP